MTQKEKINKLVKVAKKYKIDENNSSKRVLPFSGNWYPSRLAWLALTIGWLLLAVAIIMTP